MSHPGGRRSAALAVGAAFFVNGATFSNWVPRIPEVRDQLGIDNGTLGIALVGGGLGGLIGSLLTAPVQRRLGSRWTVVVAATALSASLPLIAVAPSALALGAVLVLLGGLDALNDLAMNAQGSGVQRELGRPIMQRLHASWSAGAVVGTGLGTGAAAAGVPLGWHLSLVALVLATTTLTVRRWLVDDRPERLATAGADHPRKVRLGRSMLDPAALRLAIAAFAVAIVEIGSIDWSAVMVRDSFDVRAGLVGIATFTVAGAMLVGRGSGDSVMLRIGPEHLMRRAIMLAASGIAVVALSPVAAVAVMGFALWGVGTSVLFPRLYDLGADQPTLAPAVGLAAMAVGQRIGFLIAPVAIGGMADLADIRTAMMVVPGTAVVLAGLTLVRPARRAVT